MESRPPESRTTARGTPSHALVWSFMIRRTSNSATSLTHRGNSTDVLNANREPTDPRGVCISHRDRRHNFMTCRDLMSDSLPANWSETRRSSKSFCRRLEEWFCDQGKRITKHSAASLRIDSRRVRREGPRLQNRHSDRTTGMKPELRCKPCGSFRGQWKVDRVSSRFHLSGQAGAIGVFRGQGNDFGQIFRTLGF